MVLEEVLSGSDRLVFPPERWLNKLRQRAT
jgi:hypothetical protein